MITTCNPDATSLEAELRQKSSDELRLELGGCAVAMAVTYQRAALCVKLLEERGERVQHAMVGIFRKIASGQTLAATVARFSFSPVLNDVACLPLPDQERLARDPVVPVIEDTGDGYTTRMVDLSEAPAPVARIALSRDGLLQPEEQKARLALAQRAAKAAPKPTSDDTPGEPLSASITVRFTESERKFIATAAAERGITPSAMVRQLLLKVPEFRSVKP